MGFITKVATERLTTDIGYFLLSPVAADKDLYK